MMLSYGDKVIVKEKFESTTSCVWVSDMDNFLGRICTVTGIPTPLEDGTTHLLSYNGRAYRFYESSIVPINMSDAFTEYENQLIHDVLTNVYNSRGEVPYTVQSIMRKLKSFDLIQHSVSGIPTVDDGSIEFGDLSVWDEFGYHGDTFFKFDSITAIKANSRLERPDWVYFAETNLVIKPSEEEK